MKANFFYFCSMMKKKTTIDIIGESEKTTSVFLGKTLIKVT